MLLWTRIGKSKFKINLEKLTSKCSMAKKYVEYQLLIHYF